MDENVRKNGSTSTGASAGTTTRVRKKRTEPTTRTRTRRTRTGAAEKTETVQTRTRASKKNVKPVRFEGDKRKLGLVIAAMLVFVVLVIAIKWIDPSHGTISDPQQLEVTDAAETEAAEERPIVMSADDTITSFHPTCTEDTDPSKLIKSTTIMVDGKQLKNSGDYVANETITFDSGSKYTQMDGVITFRGNNFRSSPSYGFANMEENKLESIWSQSVKSTYYKGKTWQGCGWTGQPLITTWSKEVRQHMNMYDWAKAADELTEVIYATLDGRIYFMELNTGEFTREPMQIGFTFKGAGALDPRGYPIMYVGAGYTSSKGKGRVFVVNLLDCTIMHTFGNGDSFSARKCYFFDSSALVDAETDTLIYPGENGVLYLIHLNTQYNEQNGTLTVDPDHEVKWRYLAKRNSKKRYWYGMEDSAVTYQGYLFIADNGANLMCLNLNTLELVWAQDTLDDTNCSPVLSVENGHPYIYISTSFHKGWRSSSYAQIPIFKIDAENGTILWQTEYKCSTVADVSGGVQSTAALGRNSLDDYVYVTVSRTGGQTRGVLTCLKKSTGEIVWEHEAGYAWSSPVCVYDQDGSNGKVLYCDSKGTMYLLDGMTGKVMDQISLSDGVIEASPAVYNNIAVVGTRTRTIQGVKLK